MRSRFGVAEVTAVGDFVGADVADEEGWVAPAEGCGGAVFHVDLGVVEVPACPATVRIIVSGLLNLGNYCLRDVIYRLLTLIHRLRALIYCLEAVKIGCRHHVTPGKVVLEGDKCRIHLSSSP